MRRWALVMVTVSCGRVGFDERRSSGDAPREDVLPGLDDAEVADANEDASIDASIDASVAMCSPACLVPQYCALPSGTCGGAGVCTSRPLVCFDPPNAVCGCDGMTYTSECVARVVAVNVAGPGACP